MKITATIVRSFTQHPNQGNAAGVIENANQLSDEQILFISQQLGFPESAFLQKTSSKGAHVKLRLFSVKQEVNSCVTATLAAASVVAKTKKLNHIIFETKIGIREIFIKPDGLLMMKQPPVEFFSPIIDKKKVALLLQIKEKELGEYPIELASAGTPKLLIPIKTLQTLFQIKPDLEGIAEYCREIGARGFYPFTLETKHHNADFHARQFNPQDGIAEDPVTGVAAAALTAYFKKHHIINKQRIIGEQGYIINKPGEIIIEQDGDIIFVGGYAVQSDKQIIELG